MPADPGRSGGKPSNRPDPKRPSGQPTRPSGQPTRPAPLTRQERRDAQRRAADPRLASARTVAVKRPAWQSPTLLLTLAAVAVGVVIIVIASGVLTRKATVSGIQAPLQPTPASLIDPTNARALGSASAPVTVEVWSDFQCPACKYFFSTTELGFIDAYVATGKARLVYRDYAFIDKGSAGGESHQAAAAARCAGDQGKFWQYHDYLFENQNGENKGTFSSSFLASIADAVGLDRAAYDACMANGAAAKVAEVTAETRSGVSLQISQTPTISVNGKLQAPAGATQPGGAVSTAELGAAVDAAMGSATPAPMPSRTP